MLISGLALAEYLGFEFTMLWPRNSFCGATFAELFTNDWDVVEAPATEVAALELLGGFNGSRLPDLATTPMEPFRSPGPLVPRNGSRSERIRWNGATSLDDRDLEHITGRMGELMELLAPAPAVAARVAALTDPGKPTIGVHLRRGDFGTLRPEVVRNLELSMRMVDAFLRRAPDARILLCTDDGAPDPRDGRQTLVEGAGPAYARRFPGGVVMTTPRSLDRASREAIEDALVDLLLLRRVDFFVGTAGSSFSDLVRLGRTIPATLVGRGGPGHRVLRYTGIEFAIIGLGIATLGRAVPAPTVMRHWQARLRQRRPGRGQ